MKKFIKRFTPSNFLSKNLRGFTLIELLIVIALLGALAVGLLAALDPFEQLKKGTDTGVRNTVSEVQGGAIRFYALKGNMPFCSASDPTTCEPPASATLTTADGGAPTTTPYNMIGQMVTAGELKTDFVTLAGTSQMSNIFVTGVADPPQLAVCFKPKAKSFQADVNTKYKIDGTLEDAATCKSAGGTQDCYWCVK